jgi:hypothetical protein
MPARRSQRGELRDPCHAFNDPSLAVFTYHIADLIQVPWLSCREVVSSCGRIVAIAGSVRTLWAQCEIERRSRNCQLSSRHVETNSRTEGENSRRVTHGNFRRKGPSTPAYIRLRLSKMAQIREFALLIPVRPPETGSHLTARTATLKWLRESPVK